MKISRILLFPFTLLFRLFVEIRYFLYKKSIFQSTGFDLPIISIGDITMENTGVTPMVEYFILLLHNQYKLAVLGNGKGRKSTGFKMVNSTNNFQEVGDKALQMKAKYSQIPMAVGDNQILSIPSLISNHPEVEVVLLSDAFQNLSIKPSLNVLLTNFNKPFWEDILFPSGNLKEPVNAMQRADVVVVTKCPYPITPKEKHRILSKINPHNHQKVFFSEIKYFEPYNLFNSSQRKVLNKEVEVLLFSGIVDNFEIISYLEGVSKKVYWYGNQGHYGFSLRDLETLKESYQNLGDTPKILLTSEMDAVKLISYRNWFLEQKLDLYCLPIQIDFLEDDKTTFNELILKYLNFYFEK